LIKGSKYLLRRAALIEVLTFLDLLSIQELIMALGTPSSYYRGGPLSSRPRTKLRRGLALLALLALLAFVFIALSFNVPQDHNPPNRIFMA
jgi:hypothetical protein